MMDESLSIDNIFRSFMRPLYLSFQDDAPGTVVFRDRVDERLRPRLRSAKRVIIGTLMTSAGRRGTSTHSIVLTLLVKQDEDTQGDMLIPFLDSVRRVYEENDVPFLNFQGDPLEPSQMGNLVLHPVYQNADRTVDYLDEGFVGYQMNFDVFAPTFSSRY